MRAYQENVVRLSSGRNALVPTIVVVASATTRRSVLRELRVISVRKTRTVYARVGDASQGQGGLLGTVDILVKGRLVGSFAAGTTIAYLNCATLPAVIAQIEAEP